MMRLENLGSKITNELIKIKNTNEKRGERSMGMEVYKLKIVKILMTVFILTITMLLNGGIVKAGTIPMVTEWNVPANTEIKLPIPSNEANSFTVDWGDGSTVETFDSTANFPTHTYSSAALYTIKITGTVHTFGHTSTTQPTTSNVQKDYYTFTTYLKSLVAWGELDTVRYGFSFCTNLNSTIPESSENTFTNVVDMSYLFYQCNYLSGSIPENLFANAVNVTSFDSTFRKCKNLTGSIPEGLFRNTIKVTTFACAFDECVKLTTIPENLFANTPEVTSFASTFWNCYGLKCSIPGGLFKNTKNVTTFSSTFYKCTGLSGSIPENLFENTTKVTSFYATFYECSRLTGSIPAKLFSTTTEVTSFCDTFHTCSGLTGEIPADLFKNTTKVRDFSWMFIRCYNLQGEIPADLFVNTPEVITFAWTFEKCYRLTKIPEGLFRNTTKVDNFRCTFYDCYGLRGEIPENLFENTINAQNFLDTFKYCSGLTGSIPEKLFANTVNATNFNNTFNGCSSLTGSIPENLFKNTTKVTSFYATFSGCSKLTGSIPENLFSENKLVKDFSCVFDGCRKLTGNIPENLFINNTEATSFGVAFRNTGVTGEIPAKLFEKNILAKEFHSVFSGCSGLTGSIPETLFSTTPEVTNFGHVFYGCSGLTGEIPSNLFANTPKAAYLDNAFNGCSSLTGSIPSTLFANNSDIVTLEATFSNCSNLTGTISTDLFKVTTGVTTFKNTFNGCSNLTGEISSTLFNPTPGVTTFEGTFSNCSSLEGTIPETLFNSTPGVTTLKNTFNGCSNLTGEIPSTLFNPTPSVTTFNGTFANCSSLTGEIPADLFIKATNATDFNNTFANSTSLTGSIPASLFNANTKVTTFNNTFENCTGLTGSIPTTLFASNTKAVYFDKTFAGCTNITGGVTPELFASQTLITSIPTSWGENYYADRFEKTFYNCTGLTTANINTPYIGYKMFEGCNNLRSITIGTNVKAIGTDGFEATEPYNSSNLLTTNLTTENQIASAYDWVSDNRGDGKVIYKEPEDVIAELYTEVSFEVGVSGDNLKYEWYEIISGDATSEDLTSGDTASGDDISGDTTSSSIKKLTESNTKIFKSTNKGQANTTSTSIIKLLTTEVKTLSFDYMVTSEENGDLFTITIEDANGVTTVANGISGEVDWTEFSQEFTPTDLGEITITLTYSKNDSVDSGGDYGAIRNLKCFGVGTKTSTFETDEMFTIVNTDQTVGNPDWNFVTETVDGEVIFKNGNSTVYNSMGYCGIILNVQEEIEVSFDYYVNTSENTNVIIAIMDNDGQREVVYGEMTAKNIGWTNYTGTIIPGGYENGILIAIQNMDQDTTRENIIAIKNLKVTISSEDVSTYENDSVYTFENSNWEELSYVGTDSSILTIPADFVSSKVDGNQYYCKVYNGFESVNSRQALLTIDEQYDWTNALVTEWKIPANVDKTNGTTTTDEAGNTITLGSQSTIKLPIPLHEENSYVVDWGDGIIEEFDNTADFPSHVYYNTAQVTYTIKIIGKVNRFGYISDYTSWVPSPSATNSYKNYYPFVQYLSALKAWGELGVERFGFIYCSKLKGNIPSPTKNSFINITNMNNLFYSSGLNGTIPEDLFAYATNVTTFNQTFKSCDVRGSIPEKLFMNTTNVTSFYGTFFSCSNLTGSIPENLFMNTIKVKDFDNTFGFCQNLTGTIPENLFANTPEVESFGNTFNYCTGLNSSIPEGLFAKTLKVTSFYGTFSGCSGLTGAIPEKLFANNKQAQDFTFTFSNCTGLKEKIPEKLFASATEATTFWGTFARSGVTGEIPENLFEYNDNAEDFGYTFSECSGLTGEIPANLFAKTTKVICFGYTFENCTGLTGEIPKDLFKNTPNVEEFYYTFSGCTGLTGHISEELFASNTVIEAPLDVATYGLAPTEAYYCTFAGCSGITSANINTVYIGTEMFYGCNNLTDITIGNNVSAIRSEAFYATEPYNPTNLLMTKIETENKVAFKYNWTADNRGDEKLIILHPQDVNTREYNEAQFTVVASGDNLRYQWYEVVNGTSKKLTEGNSKVLMSNNVGQPNTTSSTTIKIKATENRKLGFEYMVSSEKDGDTFTVTIEDANGIVTAVNGISGEVLWSSYEKECVPTASGEIIITLTYSKNATINKGLDYGAIRNLKYSSLAIKEFTFEEDDNFEVDSQFAFVNAPDEEYLPFVVKEEDGNRILEAKYSNNIEGETQAVVLNSANYCAYFIMIIEEEKLFSFDYRVKEETADQAEIINLGVSDKNNNILLAENDSTTLGLGILDGNGENIIYFDEATTTDGWENYTTTIVPDENNMVMFIIDIRSNERAFANKSIALKDVSIINGEEDVSTFQNDDVFTIEGTQYDTIGYQGTNTSTLTIPAEQVTLDKDGNQYYCEAYNALGKVKSSEALLTVEEGFDWENALITKWTLPVDADGVASTNGTPATTIKLPILAHANNNYAVDWGDGSEIETFDSTSDFPTHTYNNTTETTYEISVTGNVDSFGYYEEAIPTNPSDASVTTRVAEDYYTFTQYVIGIKEWGAIGLTRIGFANCTKLAGTIPAPLSESFKNITSMEKLFYNCSTLAGSIPEGFFNNATQVTSFKDTFAGCSILMGSIPETLFASNTEATDFTNTFAGCNTLSGTIPSKLFTNNRKVESFAGTFKGCMNLTGTIPSDLFVKNKEVVDFSNTFNGCSKLTGMIPARLFNFNDKVANFESTFEGCSSITAGEIRINTEIITNMNNMFKNCTALKSLVFGEEVTALVGTEVFKNCSSLSAIIMLKQALANEDLGVTTNLDTLGMPSGAIIYVPYKENEAIYESVWNNIDAGRIERIVRANDPNPDHIKLGETYVDTGYTIAGFAMDGDESNNWKQYGFFVVVDGLPVDTSEVGSEWIKYTLFKQ